MILLHDLYFWVTSAWYKWLVLAFDEKWGIRSYPFVPKRWECSIILLARSSIFCSLLSRGMFCFPCCFCMHFMFPIWNYIHLSSRGTTPLVGLHGEWFFLTFQEIFSSWTHKTDHFQRIHTTTGIPFNSMLFFDDEDRNIQSVKTKFSCFPCLLILWVGSLYLVIFFCNEPPISLSSNISLWTGFKNGSN